MSFIRCYLRASTEDQNALRARESIIAFAEQHKAKIASFYVDNFSGRKLERPELNRLLNDAQMGDVILIESIDRLTRLTASDWDALKDKLRKKKLKICAVDLPTSHSCIGASVLEGFAGDVLEAVNNMLVDILASMASKDYELRRERASQGQARAKAEGKYQGRQPDKQLHEKVKTYLEAGKSYSEVMELAGCSRGTVAKIAKIIKNV